MRMRSVSGVPCLIVLDFFQRYIYLVEKEPFASTLPRDRIS